VTKSSGVSFRTAGGKAPANVKQVMPFFRVFDMDCSVTCFTDPDGYQLEFESPTDTPEETKLSEIEN
jgi:hypothetical protein